jgi:hypothetical protein
LKLSNLDFLTTSSKSSISPNGPSPTPTQMILNGYFDASSIAFLLEDIEVT